MKRSIFLLLFCHLCLISFSQVKCFNQRPIKQNRLVYDQYGILDREENQALERKLVAYSDSTSTQIAIIIVDEVYCDMGLTAVEIGHEWGVGQGKEDNGILYLIAIDDRKIYIATGYGIEEYVPDVYVHRIIDHVIRPYFRESKYYEGLDESSNMIIDLLSGAYVAELEEPEPEGIPIWVIILFILIIFILLSRRGGGSQYDYGSDGKWVFDEKWGRGHGGTWRDFRRGRGIFIPPTGGSRGSGGFGGGGFGGFGGGGFGGGGFGGGGAGGGW